MAYIRMIIGVLIVIGVLAVMPAGVQAQSDDGLVAEWHFDEGSGSVLKDSSGNGNDGVIYGATWVDGKYGKALSFDGVDDYVEVPGSTSLDITGAITVEVWIKLSNPQYSSNRWPFILSDQTRDINGYGLQFKSGTYNQKVTFVVGTGGVDWQNTPYSTDLSLNSWHHIVGTAVDNDNIKLYIDGAFSEKNTFSGNIAGSSGHLVISGNSFNGIIDEVRIYHRALSQEEIREQYEQGPTAISLTKTASPQSIKPGQNSTITITVKNTGSTEISDIEIADTIPSYLTFIDGETSKRYDSLAPKDTRQISYTLQLNDAGTFNLEPAIATYADDKGNYNTVKSKTASIEVIRSIIENSAPTPKPTNGNVQSASVNLHGEKTDVALGEDVLLKLSAMNIIGNPTMHVQVIIIPPSGWSVTSSEFAKSGAGQYTTTYELGSGGGKDIEVRIVPNQIGDDFQVEGRIIYYFGDDVSTREDHTLNLPIKVRAKSNIEMTAVVPQSDKQSTPGFAFVVGVLGLVVAIQLIKRK